MGSETARAHRKVAPVEGGDGAGASIRQPLRAVVKCSEWSVGDLRPGGGRTGGLDCPVTLPSQAVPGMGQKPGVASQSSFPGLQKERWEA